MLVDTPNILWHGGEKLKHEPVNSLDFHPLPISQHVNGHAVGTQYLLATVGPDEDVRLWTINKPTAQLEAEWETLRKDKAKLSEASKGMQEYVGSLEANIGDKSVIRFSPNGLSLAVAGGKGITVVWTVKGRAKDWAQVKSPADLRQTLLPGAQVDICDMAWSPDSCFAAVCSIDRSLTVWEVATRRSVASLVPHSHWVQGVAWDPRDKFLATMSTDRTCKVHSLTRTRTKGGTQLDMRCSASIKSFAQTPEPGTSQTTQADAGSAQMGDADPDNEQVWDGGINEKADGAGAKSRDKAGKHHVFLSEARAPGSRRVAWTPDGSLLIAPSGQAWDEQLDKPEFCSYIFLRNSFGSPAHCLPGLQTPSTVARCCPVLFKNRRRAAERPVAVEVEAEGEPAGPGASRSSAAHPDSLTTLPYRMVFAVATESTVLVYDTEHMCPITIADNHHYEHLKDLAWSPDGLALLVASRDGCITKIHFKEGELGERIADEDVPLHTRRLFPHLYNYAPEAVAESEAECGAACAESSVRQSDGSSGQKKRLRKKITPTLVSPANQDDDNVFETIPPEPSPPAADVQLMTLEGPPKAAVDTPMPTRGAAAGVGPVVIAEPQAMPTAPPAAHVPAVKPKKRLAPTLISGPAVTAPAGGTPGPAPQVTLPPAEPKQVLAPRQEPAADVNAVNSMDTQAQVQSPVKKKKRVVPTLLSPL